MEFLNMESMPSKNLLDQSIDRYDQIARQYFNTQSAIENAPPDVREARQKQLSIIQAHLENQRVNATVLANIQSKLDAYREEGRQATQGTRADSRRKRAALEAEPHHPPGVLEKMLKAACRPKPSHRHSAHHIVPGKGRLSRTYEARVRMHLFGVRINDPDNGVWLPMAIADTPNWAMPESKAHKQYHTDFYEENVTERVFHARDEKQIRLQLQLIGKALEQNKFPYKKGA